MSNEERYKAMLTELCVMAHSDPRNPFKSWIQGWFVDNDLTGEFLSKVPPPSDLPEDQRVYYTAASNVKAFLFGLHGAGDTAPVTVNDVTYTHNGIRYGREQ